MSTLRKVASVVWLGAVAIACLLHDVLILSLFFLVLIDLPISWSVTGSDLNWEALLSSEIMLLLATFFFQLLLLVVLIVLSSVRLFDMVRFLTRSNRDVYLIRWAKNVFVFVFIAILSTYAIEGSSVFVKLPQHSAYFFFLSGILILGLFMRHRRTQFRLVHL